MSIPLFPTLKPRVIDTLWFNVDKASNDENELAQLELEHNNWLSKICHKDADLMPIGKTATERDDEEEEEEDDDETNDDEESETQDDEDDEMDVDVPYDRSDAAPGNE